MLFNIGQTFAPNAKAMTGLTFLANFSSVAFQVIVPFSADLAGPRKSGRAIAIVLFGVCRFDSELDCITQLAS